MGKGENAGKQHFLFFLTMFPALPPQNAIFLVTVNLLFAIIFLWTHLKFFRAVKCKHIPKRQILDPSKLKEFPDDNLKFDENARKFSKRVENTVGKEEIAHYEQFLLFLQRFQKTCTADT